MWNEGLRSRVPALCVVALAGLASARVLVAQADFASAVIATHPVAYYRLGATTGKSQVGTTTYKRVGGVTAMAGSPIGDGSGSYVELNGKDGSLLTTQKGEVGKSGSLMAWVNLAVLPSTTGHYFYVTGESEYGNDMDVQFETDNKLRFYTAGGGSIEYAPTPAMLTHKWHMIVATFDATAHTRALYWDGERVAMDKGGSIMNKKGVLSMGASTVFGGRWFQGGMAEVALWDRALGEKVVTAMYAARKASGSAAATGASTGGVLPATGVGDSFDTR